MHYFLSVFLVCVIQVENAKENTKVHDFFGRGVRQINKDATIHQWHARLRAISHNIAAIYVAFLVVIHCNPRHIKLRIKHAGRGYIHVLL